MFFSLLFSPTAHPCVCQLSSGADHALDALSDTLKGISPAPQPIPVLPKDIVKVTRRMCGVWWCVSFTAGTCVFALQEKKVVEEKLIKMGERDDTLPPEFHLSEEHLKVTPLSSSLHPFVHHL